MTDQRALIAPAVFAGLEAFAAIRRGVFAMPAAASGLLQEALTALALGSLDPDDLPEFEFDPEA